MSRQARLGLVVLAGVVFFLGALFILAQRSFLLTDTYRVRASFNRVSGLKSGAMVYYNGISVGRVETVRLPPSPGEPIQVTMAIRDDARHLIREDSRALIQTDGLVGNVIVALTAGTASEPVVAENGRVDGVDPLDLSQFSDKALESVQRFDSVTVTLTNIMRDVRGGEGTLGKFLYDDQLYNESVQTTQDFRASLQSFSQRADALVGIAERSSASVESILRKVNEGDGTLSRVLNEDSVYVALLQASDQFETISGDLRQITDRFENAAGWASLGAFRFSENMEALKHNFLFKGYFEDRGYFEMAPFEVREQAIQETLTDLQEWERRLYRREQELQQQIRRIETIEAELRGRGVDLPEAMETDVSGRPPGGEAQVVDGG